ncbi:hypothetical protein [Mycolicibacterium hodleri]|uniref:ESX-1 secretion-associated protein n=1 Tax=Mycolicibacterium hodleri TaxID=49897 RepID=A0A502E5V4_9MYCO|nr:hypothetical protein [Mycolicibacterium hodleri]TPG32734.1 hypothetical protein EAH80_18185 [Mycolicibacterium hodleri]
MTNTIKSDTAAARVGDLADEVRDSARAGQHAAGEALRKFRHAVDDALPESVQPLRNKIVDAAIELADQLVTAQYEFNRSIVKTADRALTKSVAEHE